MRLFATIGLLGACVCIAGLRAQSLAEHGAAAAGATIGTAAGKPISNAVTKIFGQTEEQTRSAARTPIKKEPIAAPTTTTPSQAGAGSLPGPEGSAGASSGGAAISEESSERAAAASARRAARLRRQRESAVAIQSAALPPPVAAPIPLAPLVKEPTPEEVANVKVGEDERDVLAALGVPASRVTIPDDDGHLRESYQYWAKGSQIGTVRLDNGVVVKVEARRF